MCQVQLVRWHSQPLLKITAEATAWGCHVSRKRLLLSGRFKLFTPSKFTRSCPWIQELSAQPLPQGEKSLKFEHNRLFLYSSNHIRPKININLHTSRPIHFGPVITTPNPDSHTHIGWIWSLQPRKIKPEFRGPTLHPSLHSKSQQIIHYNFPQIGSQPAKRNSASPRNYVGTVTRPHFT
jgi:hypothetical protein